MNKVITTLLIITLAALSAQADIHKGKKAYLKQCKKCHGNGGKGAAMKTQAEWTAAFENDAQGFKAWHKGTRGEKYVHGKKFKKYSGHLKDFLFEYGSDSGNIPTC